MDPLKPLTPLSGWDILSNIGSNIMHPAGVDKALGTDQVTGKPLFGGALSNLVIIVLGLLFIAAGLFQFDRTRELMTNAAKTTAAAAA